MTKPPPVFPDRGSHAESGHRPDPIPDPHPVGQATASADEAALRRSEQLLRGVIAAMEEGVVVQGARGDIQECNAAAQEILGLSADQMRGRTSMDPRWHAIHEDGSPWPGDSHPASVTLRTGKPIVGAVMGIQKPSGELCWISINAQPLIAQGTAAPYGVVASFTDITQRRIVSEELRQALKMEAIGRLAGGVAHDFNNILTAILGYTAVLLARTPPEDDRHDDLQEIRRAADRAASLTRQLLAFSRRQLLRPQVVDLNALVGNLEKMLGRLLGANVQLVTTSASALGCIRADPGQIEQVIVNLAVNARDAMPEGGTLTIETDNVTVRFAGGRKEPDFVRPGDYVAITVRDTGTGLSRIAQAHMFEPFFTTKEKGKGTGLGLATVYGIVKQSGGFIWAESEADRGAAFQIYLPRVADRPSENEAPPVQTRVKGTGTILLVEDEEPLRRLTRRLLSDLGYTVIDAGSAEEALGAAARHPGDIALALLDIVLPGQSGWDCARALEAARPGLRILFMSGFTDDRIPGDAIAGASSRLLEKPFSIERLGRAVQEAIRSRG